MPLSYILSPRTFPYTYFHQRKRHKLGKHTPFMETPEFLTVKIYGEQCGVSLPLTLNARALSLNLSSSRDEMSPLLHCNPSSLTEQCGSQVSG